MQTSTSHCLVVLIFIGLMVFANNAASQVLYGAPSAAMANTMVTDTNVWAAGNNPAGLPWLSNGGVAIGYRNAFNIQKFGTRSIAGVMPFRSGAFGISAQSFGFNGFLSHRVGFSYGLRLAEKMSIGAQLNYYKLTIGEVYGSTGYFTAALGARYAATRKLTLGAYINNLSQTKLTDVYDERAESNLVAGMSYAWSKRLRMTGEVQQSSGQKGGIRAGLEYVPMESIVLRCGGGTGPATFSFGFGWRYRSVFFIDVSSAYHNVLGFSPQVSMAWVPGGK
jgi:hypothetical protein